MKQKALIEELNKKTKGLYYLSESDYPFRVSYYSGEDHILTYIKKLSGKPESSPVEEISLSYLFRNLTSIKETNSIEANKNSVRYIDLIYFLNQKLFNINVYCIGKVQIDVYITGEINTKNYIIIDTKSVETKQINE